MQHESTQAPYGSPYAPPQPPPPGWGYAPPSQYAPTIDASQQAPNSAWGPQSYAPQGWTPQYGGYAPPAAAPAPNSRKVIAIVALVIGLFMMRNGFQQVTGSGSPGTDPREVGGVITRFLDGMQEGNVEQAVSTWDASQRDRVRPNVENMCAQVRQTRQMGGTVSFTNREINLQPASGDTCTAIVTYNVVIPQGTHPVRETYQMVHRPDGWFILGARS